MKAPGFRLTCCLTLFAGTATAIPSKGASNEEVVTYSDGASNVSILPAPIMECCLSSTLTSSNERIDVELCTFGSPLSDRYILTIARGVSEPQRFYLEGQSAHGRLRLSTSPPALELLERDRLRCLMPLTQLELRLGAAAANGYSLVQICEWPY